MYVPHEARKRDNKTFSIVEFRNIAYPLRYMKWNSPTETNEEQHDGNQITMMHKHTRNNKKIYKNCKNAGMA